MGDWTQKFSPGASVTYTAGAAITGGQVVFLSATPGPFELAQSSQIVEQVVHARRQMPIDRINAVMTAPDGLGAYSRRAVQERAAAEAAEATPGES